MSFRRVTLAAVLALFAVACGGSSSHKSAATTTTTAPAPTTVATFGGTPGVAQRLACTTNVQALQQASDLYKAMHNGPAASLDALVSESGIVWHPSVNDGYTITYDRATGHIAATGACTVR